MDPSSNVDHDGVQKRWSKPAFKCHICCRIRRTGEGNVFTGVCPFTGGYPSPRFFSRSLVLCPFQVVPHSWLGVSQSWVGSTPVLTRGWEPHYGVPSTTARTELGYPQPGLQCPQARTGLAPPPSPARARTAPPPPPHRTAERVLVTRRGGMPLAVTQEEFLLQTKFRAKKGKGVFLLIG